MDINNTFPFNQKKKCLMFNNSLNSVMEEQ